MENTKNQATNEDNTQVQLWKTEQEIMDVIHHVCVEENLRYSLCYGTLLGAVRHKGFIPWDDDIDIIMPREDYEKLREIWPIKAPKGYILQDPYENPDLPDNFIKIRKDHTCFIQTEDEKEKQYHKGVFVDIFPADRVATGKVARILQQAFCCIDLLYNRGYTSKSGGIVELGEKLLLAIVPSNNYRKVQGWAERQAIKWNKDETAPWFTFSTIRAMKKEFHPDVFENLKLMEFEGAEYFAFSNFDTILTMLYGEYMQLPPVEERAWKHHPIQMDLNRNYEELC